MDSWADPKNYKDFFFVRKEVTQLAKQMMEREEGFNAHMDAKMNALLEQMMEADR